jgi:hypothetical protein
MVYKPLAARVAMIAGFQINDSSSRSRGNVGIPAGISKGCGKVGKPTFWLSMRSIPRHSMARFARPALRMIRPVDAVRVARRMRRWCRHFYLGIHDTCLNFLASTFRNY